MAKAKAKAAPKQEVPDTIEEIITEDEVKEPTPTISKASNTEKKESFTAVFATEAHAEAIRAFEGSEVEIVSIDESSAGDAGTTVTVTFK